MPTDNILVIAVDGLRASALGAYGNTWFATPAFDHFATESFLLDAYYANSAELPLIYRALWHTSLPKFLAEHHYQSTLITDEPALQQQTHFDHFDRCLLRTDQTTLIAESIGQTAMAQLFAEAGAAIEQPRENETGPQLIWIHARGLYAPWDAPRKLHETLLEEGDPVPDNCTTPPDYMVTDSSDPDAIFASSCRYAAQIMVLDACLDSLFEIVQKAWSNENWVEILLGTRGFPLGEHQRIGGIDQRLYAEQLHVPSLLRFPNGQGQLVRCGQLATHLDLFPTLSHWVTGGAAEHPSDHLDQGRSLLPLIEDPKTPWRDAIISTSSTGQRALRTPQWCLRSEASEEGSAELYVRPDDRWEANNVAELCPDVVEEILKKNPRT